MSSRARIALALAGSAAIRCSAVSRRLVRSATPSPLAGFNAYHVSSLSRVRHARPSEAAHVARKGWPGVCLTGRVTASLDVCKGA
ncbi:hypothetical protein WL86_28095 [Burkholderia diffusa]|nr:hypothetical protein WL86_28095 [Burkholderia diffusa]